jgi:GTP-binding protein
MTTYVPPSKRQSRQKVQELPKFDTTIKELPLLTSTTISSKPWFVVATKADLPDTQDNYRALQVYLKQVHTGAVPHPSNRKNAWKYDLQSIPVSAINAAGVEAIPRIVMDLLDE